MIKIKQDDPFQAVEITKRILVISKIFFFVDKK